MSHSALNAPEQSPQLCLLITLTFFSSLQYSELKYLLLLTNVPCNQESLVPLNLEKISFCPYSSYIAPTF